MNTLDNLEVNNKTVLVRVDFNVPVDNGVVTDVTRIQAAKPTIDHLRDQQAKVVLLAHFGRPKGEVKDELRLKHIVPTVSDVLGVDVKYAEDCVGLVAEEAVGALAPGEVLLLENVRFHPGEKNNDVAFVDQLVKLGDAYVNDAFGAAHREHASTAGVAAKLPHAAGLLMQREVEELTKVLEHPEAPVCAIVGGSKISTKMALIENLLPRVDHILLGGALANTVLLAQGHPVGKSLVEEDLVDTVKGMLSDKVVMPVDLVVAKDIDTAEGKRVVGLDEVAEAELILDIGPKSVELYAEKVQASNTVLWNGPMGVFEVEAFSEGTVALAKQVADSSAYSVLGGGETVSAVKQSNLSDDISFISTGGGAMLEFLEGKTLPGIAALS